MYKAKIFYKMFRRSLLFTVILLTVGISSCNESLIDMNENPLALSELPDEYLFTTGVRQIMRGDIGDYDLRFNSQYAHIYVTNSEMRASDSYKDFHTQDIYRFMFENNYINSLRNINEVVSLTAEGKYENPVRNAIARITASVEFARMTDLWGDIPYFEGAKGLDNILYPKYDRQEEIYKDIISQLKNAIGVLEKADPSMGYAGADPVYDNNLGKWAKFANSFRLRLAMRIRFADPAYSAGIITECMAHPFIEWNNENFGLKFQESENSELYNPWYDIRKHQDWKMSDKFVEWLKATNDPRLEILVDTTKAGEYKGYLNGINDQATSQYQWTDFSAPKPILYSKSQPRNMMTASEVWFLRAEAALFNLAPGNANELYQTGIRRNLEFWNVQPAKIDNYLNTQPEAALNGTTENKFRQIATQMWIAFVPDFTEAYSNIRRTGYPVIPQRTDSETFSLGVTNGILPKRFKYSSSEYRTNKANVDIAVENQGPDLIDTPVWWDVRD